MILGGRIDVDDDSKRQAVLMVSGINNKQNDSILLKGPDAALSYVYEEVGGVWLVCLGVLTC